MHACVWYNSCSAGAWCAYVCVVQQLFRRCMVCMRVCGTTVVPQVHGVHACVWYNSCSTGAWCACVCVVQQLFRRCMVCMRVCGTTVVPQVHGVHACVWYNSCSAGAWCACTCVVQQLFRRCMVCMHVCGTTVVPQVHGVHAHECGVTVAHQVQLTKALTATAFMSWSCPVNVCWHCPTRISHSWMREGGVGFSHHHSVTLATPLTALLITLLTLTSPLQHFTLVIFPPHPSQHTITLPPLPP